MVKPLILLPERLNVKFSPNHILFQRPCVLLASLATAFRFAVPIWMFSQLLVYPLLVLKSTSDPFTCGSLLLAFPSWHCVLMCRRLKEQLSSFRSSSFTRFMVNGLLLITEIDGGLFRSGTQNHRLVWMLFNGLRRHHIKDEGLFQAWWYHLLGESWRRLGHCRTHYVAFVGCGVSQATVMEGRWFWFSGHTWGVVSIGGCKLDIIRHWSLHMSFLILAVFLPSSFLNNLHSVILRPMSHFSLLLSVV